MSKEVISTLQPEAKLIYDRRCGNTTRQVDLAIQLLFQGKIVKCEDHITQGVYVGNHIVEKSEDSTVHHMNKRMLKIILRRLDMEHGYVIRENKVKVDHDKFTIELILD